MGEPALRARVAGVLLDSVAELNSQLSPAQRLPQSLDAPLTGSEGRLDSLGLINFIVIAEQKLEEEFGRRICLTDENIVGAQAAAFATLGTLAEYLVLSVDGSIR